MVTLANYVDAGVIYGNYVPVDAVSGFLYWQPIVDSGAYKKLISEEIT